MFHIPAATLDSDAPADALSLFGWDEAACELRVWAPEAEDWHYREWQYQGMLPSAVAVLRGPAGERGLEAWASSPEAAEALFAAVR